MSPEKRSRVWKLLDKVETVKTRLKRPSQRPFLPLKHGKVPAFEQEILSAWSTVPSTGIGLGKHSKIGHFPQTPLAEVSDQPSPDDVDPDVSH